MNLTEIQNISKAFSTLKPFSKRPDICTAICLATAQSICWGKKGVTLVELGVFKGAGLKFITQIVEYITKKIKMEYRVYGFDSFEGLQDFEGYKDHHEIWEPNQYKYVAYDKMVEKFNGRAVIIKGNVQDTVKEFLVDHMDMDYPIGFISLDLDLYSATKAGLKIMEDADPNKYIPTVLMVVDDQDYLVTYNDWCGEGAAIREFNESNELRKIQNRREIYQRLRCIHVLDHDLRTGKVKAKLPLTIGFHKFINFDERAIVIV